MFAIGKLRRLRSLVVLDYVIRKLIERLKERLDKSLGKILVLRRVTEALTESCEFGIMWTKRCRIAWAAGWGIYQACVGAVRKF